MTNNELLLAISDMMDKKLDARLLPIETDMKDMKADMQNMKADMQHMKTDMQHMQTDIQHIKTDIKNIEERVTNIEEKVTNIEERVTNIEERVLNIEERVTNIELHLENETDKNIALLAENCIPAARKYEKETEKIEAMQDDIHIMKKVIKEHSKKLQNIS